MHVFACILSVFCINACTSVFDIELLFHVTIRLNGSLALQRAASARSPRCRRWRKFVARAAQAQSNNQKFIWIGSARLDCCSRRQLEQQRICCALKRLGAVGCQWSTTRRQRNDIDEQNNNSSRSIRQPLLRQQSWISRSTYTSRNPTT